MTRRFMIPATLLLLAGVTALVRGGPAAGKKSSSNAAPPTSATRPNVVLISLDTLRADHLGCYGYSQPTSPNIDRLAASGIVFRKTWTPAPWTLPAHMSLFTSLMPSEHGVDSVNRVLPGGTVTLPQLLDAAGYETAGLVNDGQMRSDWGFSRGFDEWREFPVDTPEGSCEHITAEAIDWLAKQKGDRPFFLFLHYYDAHDSYAPPPKFRRQFGSQLSGDQARQLAWHAREPGKTIGEDQIKQLIGAYDGEIAWMDHELGKLFAKLPEDTLVVLFSDHGEAFEEHGWTLHGATLYEEETRVPLIMRLPRGRHARRTIDSPATLMDVAPTVLELCGIEPPAHFRGESLVNVLEGKPALPRIISAQTKAVLEGRVLRSVIVYPWKLVHSALDDALELYRLPDEHTNLADREPDAVAALRRHIDMSLADEDHWLLQARGSGKHEINIEASDGRFALFIPAGFEQGRDSIQTSSDGRRIDWIVYPDGGTKTLYLELSNPRASLTLDARIDDAPALGRVFAGRADEPVAKLPVELPSDHSVLPESKQYAMREEDGVHVLHYADEDLDPRDDNTRTLDEVVIKQLRALGYIE